MKTCKSGRLITKERGKDTFYVIRLNFIEVLEESGKSKYSTKDIHTHLLANKKNYGKAAALLDEAIQEHSNDTNNIYFEKYCALWLEDKRRTVELITYEGYAYKVKHIMDYFAGKKIRLAEVSPEHINAFWNLLLTKERTATTQHKAEGLSNRTIKDIAVLTRTILDKAVSLEQIKRNPAKNVTIPQQPEVKEEKAYIGVDELNMFLTAIKGHRLEVPFIFALYYGMRREEICGLRWEAIRDGKIYIENTVTRLKTTVEKKRTKTEASHRSYPIPEEIRDRLQQIRDCQNYYKAKLGKEYKGSSFVFTWEDGRPYTPDYLTKNFKKLVKAHDGLDNSLTLHSLRASCVSIMIHDGIDVKNVQAWVGHSDVQTTLNIYARTNDSEKNRTANRMSGLLFQNS